MKYVKRLKQLLGRKDYISDHKTVIHRGARIINNRGKAGAITIGAHSHIKGELLTFGHGGNIVIGSYCYIGEQSRIWSASSINIGDRVLISHNVNVFDNITHPLEPAARHKQFCEIISHGHPRAIDLLEQPVSIQEDALIGCMAIILKGVTVGKAAIVGAGSVVTKDVPPYTIVAGNPARVIREIDRN